MPTPVYTVLFDLDGTFLDTAPDLIGALNKLRAEEGLDKIAEKLMRPHVSNGSIAIIENGFNITAEDEPFERLKVRFLKIYEDNIAELTRPFPGMEDVVSTLEQNNIPWGIVTNKPGWLTEPLLEALSLTERCGCIVSSDTLPEKKPHPAPLLHGCKLAGGDPTLCVYVGDAERDIEAGRRAGMKTLIAKYGYISEQDQIDKWQADDTINHPAEILEWLHEQSILTIELTP